MSPSSGLPVPGSRKSSLTDELVRRFLNEIPSIRIAVLSVDPTKQNRRRFVRRPNPDECNCIPPAVNAQFGHPPVEKRIIPGY